MDGDQEIPDVRFWGMVVSGGQTATYAIENEHGLMELCHLTNIALESECDTGKPIYVRIRGPEEEQEFTLGALIPGKLYSFSTDLMISPDTSFTHTGGKGVEVHLTGYRSISAETVLLGDDDDDDEDEEDESEDSEDRDFIVRDGEEDDDSADSEDEPRQHRTNGKLAPEAQKRAIQQRKLLGMDSSDEDDAVEEGDSLEGADLDSEAEGSEEEEADVDPSHKAAAISKALAQSQRIEVEKARQQAGAKTAQDAEGEDDFEMDDDDEEELEDDDDDDDAVDDDQPKPQAKPQAGKRLSIAEPIRKEVDKATADFYAEKAAGKRALPQASPAPAAAKKAKTQPAGTPAKSPAKPAGKGPGALPPHPDKTTPVTRQYVEDVVAFLRQNGGEYSMSKLGIEVKRPKEADKIGKLLKSYDTWFRRSGTKGQELLVLKLK